MKRILWGEKFKYEIDVDFQHKTFEINAKHLNSKKVSSITNTNVILSEFSNLYTKNDLVEENVWEIADNNTLKSIIKKTEICFKNPEFIYFVEKELIKDIAEGGWNGAYIF